MAQKWQLTLRLRREAWESPFTELEPQNPFERHASYPASLIRGGNNNNNDDDDEDDNNNNNNNFNFSRSPILTHQSIAKSGLW